IWKDRSAFRRMGRHLEKQGFSVHPIDLVPNDGSAGIDELAGQVKTFIDTSFPDGSPIDLLGFSMGGVVSRYYVQRLGGIERVRRFITISSPHHGTHWARARDLPGYLHMRPDSPLLADLNRDVDMLSRLNFTSMWTPLDLMIVPPQSSRLPVGEEIL